MSEGLWLLAGRNDIAALKPYNKRIDQFSDDNLTLNSAYGYRMKDQILPLLQRLKKDPADRRGVLIIWDAEELMKNTKDPCCNDLVFFKVRQGELHMTVCNRSNDIHWGLYAVNLSQFSMLQEVLADQLGVGMGTQIHLSNSLHVYLDGVHADINRRMLEARNRMLPRLPGSSQLSCGPIGFRSIQKAASYAIDGVPAKNLPFFEFATAFLKMYRDKVVGFGELPHADQFADWIAAARYYLKEIEYKGFKGATDG